MSRAPTGRDSAWWARRFEEVAVVLATAWVARPFIRPGRYVTGFDTAVYSGPNLRFTLQELTHGRIPLWNDTIFGGAPHLGNTQTGALYLPKLLVAGMNLNRAMSLLVAAHLLLLAGGMLAVMRRLGCRPPAGFVAAFAAVACGAVLTRTIQFEQILVIAWAPAVMVAIHAVLTTSRPWRASGVAALVFAGAVLAGHPQMTYLVGAIAAAWTVGVGVAARAPRRLGHLAAAGLAAGLLLGLQLLATRAATASSAITGGRSLDSLRLPDRSIQPGLMARVLLGTVADTDPGYNAGAFETVGYVGAAVLALAVAGLVTNARRGPRRAVALSTAALAVVSAVLATGSRTGLFDLLYHHLPGFDLMRVSGRWITVTDLSLAVLAGLGIDGLRRREGGRSSLLAIGAASLATALLALTGRVSVDATAVSGWLVGAALVAAGIWLATGPTTGPTRRRRAPAGAAWILPLLGVGFELGVANRHSLNLTLASGASFTNYTSAPTEWLKGQPGLVLALTGDRIGDTAYLLPTLRPNANTLYGIRSIDGYDGGVQVSERWLAMVGSFNGAANFELTMRAQMPAVLEPSALARYGVRWVMIDTGMAPDRLPGWRGPVAADPVVEVFENPAWVGEGVLRPPGTADEVAVALRRRSPRAIDAEVSSDRAGRLVVSAQWDAGWRVSVDGRPAAIVAADGFMLGVDLPAGDHRVRFRYRPGWLVPGVTSMLLGTAAVAAMLLADRRRAGLGSGLATGHPPDERLQAPDAEALPDR